ncbi:MAG: Wzz/FepE/Etk N-terminal domain-containing protein [Candidatus Erginobacter occultus]|nr:Wzz/FepE/Etk N-terminal domain-containing protein [Candidatus Erginobacter occultus]
MSEQEINLLELFVVMKKRKVLIISLTLILTLLGFGYAVFLRPVEYTAEGIIRVGQVGIMRLERVEEKQIETVDTVVSTWGSPFKFLDIIATAELRYIPPDDSWRSPEWLKNIFVIEIIKPDDPRAKADLVKISVTWRDPSDAAALANAQGEVIISDHRRKFSSIFTIEGDRLGELEKEIARITETVGSMEETQRKLEEETGVGAPEVILLQANMEDRLRLLSELRAQLNQSRLGLSELLTYPTDFVQRPVVPLTSDPRRRALITGAAFILGLTISTVGALVSESLKRLK